MARRKNLNIVVTQLAVVTFVTFILNACSSAPKHGPDDGPEWTHQTTRTVDQGYIVYVGTGEDNTADRARFKAESMALQDLANECSFAPKGVRIEDHYDGVKGVIHQSFAKVAIQSTDCEAAQAATDPESIRKLASEPLASQLKRYQDLVDEPEPEETEEYAENDTHAPIRNTQEFVIVRQQVFFAKQDVILAPPGYYAPQSQRALAFQTRIAVPIQRSQGFVQANPGVVTNQAPTFSAVRPNPVVHQASALRNNRAGQAQFRNSLHGGQPRRYQRGGSRKGESTSGGGKRRRRRKDD